MKQVIKTSVVPFDTLCGTVKAHEILCHNYHKHFKTAIESVVFKTWDDVAGMMVETVVHWTKWTKYMITKWPEAGEIVSVLLRDGQRVYVKAYYSGMPSGEVFERSPIVARHTYKLVTLYGDFTLLEIAGVQEWVDKGYPEDASMIVDPFERDNKEFHAQFPHLIE